MFSNEPSTSKYVGPSYNPSIVQIPQRLPVIEGLHQSVHSLSLESIRTLRNLFHSADAKHSGLLTRHSILRCLAEVIPNAAHPNSPWRRFCESISAPHQLFPHGDLIKLINAEKHGDRGVGPSIEEILSLQKCDHLQDIGDPLRRVQSDRTFSDRSYAKLIIDLELLISKSPDKVDIDRLKMATRHNVISVKEFIDIVSIYGAEKLLEPIIGRIITTFQDTRGKFKTVIEGDSANRDISEDVSTEINNLCYTFPSESEYDYLLAAFHYGEFVKCLDRIQPSLLLGDSANSVPLSLPPSLASERVPLGPILSAEREQQNVSEWNDKEWEQFYLKADDEE